MKAAGKGKTPLTLLVVAGHHYINTDILKGNPSSPAMFAIQDILQIAKANGIGDNKSRSC